MTTNLNQVVNDILSHYQDANLASEEARKKISSEIVNKLMDILAGDDQIEEFEQEDVTIFLSEPPVFEDENPFGADVLPEPFTTEEFKNFPSETK